MARSVNYAAKIEKLEEKISKKKAELDRLQEELKVLKQKKDEHDYGALLDYMKENNLSAEQVLTSIKPEESCAVLIIIIHIGYQWRLFYQSPFRIYWCICLLPHLRDEV
ncbi:MAG: hypothetical protein MR630_08150 [Selenomonas sp.]|uniref:hypothetical protein n=1 Tax=Selenomonas sp. TaxID=2053611 RepID=UPI0025EC85C1|nr:hypothetical protein [Selenomonas sp.]MCI6232565.1 hypothetical protein [Selenomonas sp.]